MINYSLKIKRESKIVTGSPGSIPARPCPAGDKPALRAGDMHLQALDARSDAQKPGCEQRFHFADRIQSSCLTINTQIEHLPSKLVKTRADAEVQCCQSLDPGSTLSALEPSLAPQSIDNREDVRVG